MRYKIPSKNLFVNNRKKFVTLLKPNALAVFNSNDIMPTNGDGHMGFKQNSDLFYLSGIDQEESILIIFPNAFDKNQQEILFVKETSDLIKIWEGEKLTKEKASAISGVKNVMWLKDFPVVFNNLMCQAEHVYLNTNEHLRAHIEVETRDARFVKWCREHYPIHRYERSAPIMHKIKAVKELEEIEMMQKACDLTESAFRRVLSFIKPGVIEYEIEAEFLHEFIKNGSRGFAYGPIVASGPNACVLHYVENDKEVKAGDVILLDIGCEYGNYNSDMTRCLPISGRFTARQKQVYNAVLHVKNEAEKLLRPGIYLQEYQKEVGKIMEGELIKLGLIDSTDIKNQDPSWPAYKKYFMHGTSHFLGIEVHDSGLWTEPIKEGMVFTCEPGIYIPEEGLGIRLEDNLVITNDKPFNLMRNIPLLADEIEDLMNR